MRRRPPESTLTAPLFPSTTLFRSVVQARRHRQQLRLGGAVQVRPAEACRALECAVLVEHHPGRDKTRPRQVVGQLHLRAAVLGQAHHRSEEHTSELQSLMRISYAVFCLKKKKTTQQHQTTKE